MNREMRRLSEREERRNKKDGGRRGRKPQAGGKGASEKQSRFGKIAQFLREVRVELKRVGWPSRQQMVAFTSVTLITSTTLTLVTFLMDVAFRRSVLAFVRSLTG